MTGRVVVYVSVTVMVQTPQLTAKHSVDLSTVLTTTEITDTRPETCPNAPTLLLGLGESCPQRPTSEVLIAFDVRVLLTLQSV